MTFGGKPASANQVPAWDGYKYVNTNISGGGGGGGGSAPAIDSNHQYVYACNEASGSTSLTNTGHGVNGSLSFQGAEGTDYSLAFPIGVGAKAIHVLRNGNVPTVGVYSAQTCALSSSNFSAECLFANDNNPSNAILILADSYSLGLYAQFYLSGNQISWSVNNNGTPLSTTTVALPIFGPPIAVMGTWQASTGTAKLYINGILASSIVYGAVAMITPNFNRMQIGNFGAVNTTYACAARVTQVRWSSVTRNAAEALTSAKTMLAM